MVSCTLPTDGDYLIRLSDFAYQAGGPESVYRLVVSTAPWIDTAYPAVIPAGKPSPVTLFERNLPGGKPVPGYPGREQLTVTPEPFPGRLLPRVGSVDGFGYRLTGSNPLFLGLADAPVVLDNDDNNVPEKVQPVAVAADIRGRFERSGDRDYDAFTAKKGDVVVIEGYADRLRSLIDLSLSVRAAPDGRVIGEFDSHPDLPDRADQFYTYTDDPFGKITIPADGTYHLLVRSQDAAARVALRDTYCVSLRKEHPDFRRAAVGNHDNGAGLTLPRGSSQSVQVVCFRHDGFDGGIALAAHGLPAGVTCEPLYCRRAFDVPAELLKQKGVTFRLKVASDSSAVVTLNGTVADEDTGDHEFSYWNRDVEIPTARLKARRNVIAVKVDNTAASSDVFFDPAVVGLVPIPDKT